MARPPHCNISDANYMKYINFKKLTELRLCTKINHFQVKSIWGGQNDQIRLAHPAQDEPCFLFKKISLNLIGLQHRNPALHALTHGDKAIIFCGEIPDLRLIGDLSVQSPLAVQSVPNEIGAGCPRQQEEDDGDEDGAESSADDHFCMVVRSG